MKIIFNIDYRTNWGESVYITGNIPELGGGDFAKALKLNLDGVDKWWGMLDVKNISDIAYKYIVRRDDGSVKEEWGDCRSLRLYSYVPSCHV